MKKKAGKSPAQMFIEGVKKAEKKQRDVLMNLPTPYTDKSTTKSRAAVALSTSDEARQWITDIYNDLDEMHNMLAHIALNASRLELFMARASSAAGGSLATEKKNYLMKGKK